jgi:hypothetical protein
MSALKRIAYFQNRRDEGPNQELARDLAQKKDREGIREIAENLWNKDRNVQSDCLKVLYEIGYIDPRLIAGHVADFLRLLKSKNNRLVWGSMIALGTVAELEADAIFEHVEEIKRAMAAGSVITKDNGVKALAGVASKKEAYRRAIFPFLADHLATCRPKDVAQHAEKTLVAVDGENKQAFIAVLEKRMVDLSGAQATRVKKVIKDAEKR